jgi:hypothetical protein
MAMTFWTREEESRLVRELRDGLTIEDIAAAHQRTPGAVLARTSRMAPEDLDLRTRAQRTEWLREQLLTDPDYDWTASLAATRRRQHEETRANASRHGKAWTQADDEQVLAGVTTGVSIRDLAAQVQRSPKSTARRIYDLVHRDDTTSRTDESGTAAAPAGTSPAAVQTTVREATAAASVVSPSPTPATFAAGVAGLSAHGQPWTEDETGKLLGELGRGLLVDDIAALHQRSVRAINGRAAIVLTQLTGIKHALREDSAAQLCKHLLGAAAAPAGPPALVTDAAPDEMPAATSGQVAVEREAGQQDAINVVRDVLGATVLKA